jgi:hypothetical protein
MQRHQTRIGADRGSTLFLELRKRFKKGGGGKAPPPVDPVALGKAQLDANLGTANRQAEINNVRTTSPFGYSGFEEDENGRWNLSQNLSPELQRLFGQQTGLSSALTGLGSSLMDMFSSPAQGGANLVNNAYNRYATSDRSPVTTNGLPDLVNGLPGLQTSLDYSGLIGLPTSATDFGDLAQQAQDAAYRSQSRYLDPQFAQQKEDLRQQLADQGISPGNQAYSRSQDDYERAKNFAYSGARDAAIGEGNAEQARLFGQNLASRQQGTNERLQQGQFANQARAQDFGQKSQARQQMFGERQQLWQNPINELSSVTQTGNSSLANVLANLGGLRGFGDYGWANSIPTYGSQNTTVSPVNVAGIQSVANQAGMNRFAAGNTLNNQLTNGLGSLGGAAFGGSGGLGGLFGGGGGLSSLFGGGGAASALGDFGGGGAAAGIADSIEASPALAAAAWIVCTELMHQGRLPKRWWAVGSKVFDAYPEIAKRGYYLWAIPSVHHLRRKPNSIYSRVLARIFNWRAEDIAARAGVKGARKLWRGRAVTAALALPCLALGLFVRKQDWRSVYREEVAK